MQSGGDVRKSADGGVTWNIVETGIANIALDAHIHDFCAVGDGQLGASIPNCLAYSTVSRCQPPSFIESPPAMRPMGVPLRK